MFYILHAILLFLPGSLGAVTYSTLSICAQKGSSVTIPCQYNYSDFSSIKVITAKWFLSNTDWNTESSDYVYHTKENLINAKYQNRSEYLGNAHRNCTLKIRNIQSSDSNTYTYRYETDKDYERFTGTPGVMLKVSDSPLQVKMTLWEQNSDGGDKISLTCRTTSCTPTQTEIIWYKNGWPISNRTSHTLDFHPFSHQDCGSYSCAMKDTNNRTPEFVFKVKGCLAMEPQAFGTSIPLPPMLWLWVSLAFNAVLVIGIGVLSIRECWRRKANPLPVLASSTNGARMETTPTSSNDYIYPCEGIRTISAATNKPRTKRDADFETYSSLSFSNQSSVYDTLQFSAK
ncbi:sialoadhesin [Amia ocellicauda]|uniref:sialoadhesin n=1 Tax=Amia ocellicauda TaxID=2972642 RepID=UPI0034641E3F